MRTARVLLLAGAFFLSHCSDRSRDNPLDPLNPVTGGKPEPPALSSDRKTVFVRWTEMDNHSITGYRVWRRSPGEREPEPLATVDRPSTVYTDTLPAYDTPFSYQVSALTPTFESPLSPPDSITAGPFNYWVADFFRGTVSVVTYDGAHLLREDYTDTPAALAFDPSGTFLWVATYYPAMIVKRTLDGEEVFSHRLGSFPVDMAVNARTGSVWVVTSGESYVVRLDASTGAEEHVSTDMVLSRESRLDIDPSGDHVWVTVADSDRVLKVGARSPHKILPFSVGPFPRGVVTMADPAMAWVATDSGVVGIDSAGGITRYLSRFSILDIDIHQELKQVWLVAYDTAARTTSVRRLKIWQGVWKGEEVALQGTYTLWKIRVNPGSDHPGLIVYDLAREQLVRLDGGGKPVGKRDGFSPRLDILVEE